MAFLNKTGAERLWSHVISKLSEKVDKINGRTQLGIYVQDTEPTSVREGTVWMDTSSVKHVSLTYDVAIDDTLSVEGMVAEAKATGDAINSLATLVNELQAKVTALETELNSKNYIVTSD